MKIRHVLQLEGAAIFVLSLYLYTHMQGDWWLFGFLILSPDLAMIGYSLGLKVGTFCYNLVHNYVLPASLAAYGIYMNDDWLILLSIIWFAHIGMDRMIGYGLKYTSGFKNTHFEKI